ncbi:uncharacterized protein [Diabrotica undecimpunctata]|uniref:uncharacterized protein n=1 Tax=Diabrotica undecimpunctata TaxID=50387 RepID=UPI003B63809C
MVHLQRRGNNFQKPKAVIDYNSGKSSIDLSDLSDVELQYGDATNCPLVQKIAIEILLGTSIVNAYFIYKEAEQTNISINDFRYAVIEELLKFEGGQFYERTRRAKVNLNAHVFTKLDCKARKNRRYCKGCYKRKQDGLIDKNKVKKVITYCVQCENTPRFCLECFNLFHKTH